VGPDDAQSAGFDDFGGFRSALTEALWAVEGLDRLALVSGLPPERVEALSQKVSGELHDRSSQGEPTQHELVAWVWKNYFAAMKREHRALKQERGEQAAGTPILN
jgi:hypothetical protein